MAQAPSESPQLRHDFARDGETIVRTYHGSFDDCKAYADSINMETDVSPDGGRYSSLSISRLNAQRATLEISSKKFKELSWWGMTFCEISKPIKTWIALKIQDPDEQIKELGKITAWEQQLANGNITAYLEYRYDGVNKITNESTLKLAQKIRSGIDSYSIYAPVVTCTRTSMEPFTDKFADIGKYCTLLEYPTGFPPANLVQFQSINGLKPYWLKQSDAVSQNTDGSITRTEQWQGLDSIDMDLYEAAGSDSTSAADQTNGGS